MTVVTAQLESRKLKVAKVDTVQEDMSFWEELEILNEEGIRPNGKSREGIDEQI